VRKRVLLTIGAVVLAASGAQATVLATTSLYAPSGYTPSCTVTNLGTKTTQVNVRIIGNDGTDIDSAAFQIPPGSSTGLGTNVNFNGYARCQFEFKGSRKSVRAALTIDENVSGLSQTVLPAE
jgi:hypothetical protein